MTKTSIVIIWCHVKQLFSNRQVIFLIVRLKMICWFGLASLQSERNCLLKLRKYKEHLLLFFKTEYICMGPFLSKAIHHFWCFMHRMVIMMIMNFIVSETSTPTSMMVSRKTFFTNKFSIPSGALRQRGFLFYEKGRPICHFGWLFFSFGSW